MTPPNDTLDICCSEIEKQFVLCLRQVLVRVLCIPSSVTINQSNLYFPIPFIWQLLNMM